MTSTTLLLKEGDAGASIFYGGWIGSYAFVEIRHGADVVTLKADNASARKFFVSLHDATGAIIDRLTLARLEAEEASNKVCSE